MHLIRNSFPEGFVTTFLDSFPVIVSRWTITINCADIADLACSPVIRTIVETIENSSCHRPLLR